MKTITESNRPNFLIIIAILYILMLIIFWRQIDSIVRFSLIILGILFLGFYILRVVTFEINEGQVAIKFQIIKFCYKQISVKFDSVRVVKDEAIRFISLNSEILEIRLEPTDSESGDQHILRLEILYLNRIYSVGNSKNALNLFRKVEGGVSGNVSQSHF